MTAAKDGLARLGGKRSGGEMKGEEADACEKKPVPVREKMGFWRTLFKGIALYLPNE